MNFLQGVWDWFWLLFWVFAYMAYLFVLIYIIFDIFRDRSLNGWLKALWLFLLVFMPFVTGLVYLIARGKGMAERSARNDRSRSRAPPTRSRRRRRCVTRASSPTESSRP
ncbi:MAG: hypothetical protein K0S05_3153 [Agromyces sp.]|nr:hypothetical protein [Agromyces sp.]